MEDTVFVTYNPGNGAEELLAVRLHTIGAVNGFTMYLPDRYHSAKEISPNTLHFIRQSGWLVFFSFGGLSDAVRQEINAASRHTEDKSRIVVVSRGQVGEADKFTSIDYDPAHENMHEALQKIGVAVSKKMLALMGIGLGLFALESLDGERG